MKKPAVYFAKIPVKPEFYEDAKHAILSIIPQTLKEPGCKVFALHESIADGDRSLYLYEIFDSPEAFDFHHAQSYTKAVRESYQKWLKSPVEIIKLSKIT